MLQGGTGRAGELPDVRRDEWVRWHEHLAPRGGRALTTDRKIIDTIPDNKPPQVTFTCSASGAPSNASLPGLGGLTWPQSHVDTPGLIAEDAMGECKFQFWVDRIESFYCNLEKCSWDSKDSFGEDAGLFAQKAMRVDTQTRTRPTTAARRSTALVSPGDSFVARTAASVSGLVTRVRRVMTDRRHRRLPR